MPIIPGLSSTARPFSRNATAAYSTEADFSLKMGVLCFLFVTYFLILLFLLGGIGRKFYIFWSRRAVANSDRVEEEEKESHEESANGAVAVERIACPVSHGITHPLFAIIPAITITLPTPIADRCVVTAADVHVEEEVVETSEFLTDNEAELNSNKPSVSSLCSLFTLETINETDGQSEEEEIGEGPAELHGARARSPIIRKSAAKMPRQKSKAAEVFGTHRPIDMPAHSRRLKFAGKGGFSLDTSLLKDREALE